VPVLKMYPSIGEIVYPNSTALIISNVVQVPVNVPVGNCSFPWCLMGNNGICRVVGQLTDALMMAIMLLECRSIMNLVNSSEDPHHFLTQTGFPIGKRSCIQRAYIPGTSK
jgi:hypothetical protein